MTDLETQILEQTWADDKKRRKAIYKLVIAGSGECHSALVTALEEISDNCRRAEEGEMDPEILIDSVQSWLDGAFEAVWALENFLPTSDISRNAHLTEAVHISPETFAAMTRIAIESGTKVNMPIGVDTCVETACKNSIAERTGGGRTVILREQ